MYIIIVELDVLSGSNKELCWSILTDRDIVVYLSVQFFPATETWKHDRRRGHHWATSDWSAFLKKGRLHHHLPCSTFRTEKLKIIHLAVFLSCQSDSFVRQKPKLNIPSEVFRRQKWDTRLQMRAGAGLKMTHYYGNRTKYCGNRGAAGLKNLSSADFYWKHLNRNNSGDIYKVNRNDPGSPQVHFILTIYCNHSNNSFLGWHPKFDATAYHTGKEPSPRHRLLEAMAERIQLLLHPCCGTPGFCVNWHHTQHIRVGEVGSHDNGQQLDCCHTVGRSQFPHFVVPPWYSPAGVSLSPTSLRGDSFE